MTSHIVYLIRIGPAPAHTPRMLVLGVLSKPKTVNALIILSHGIVCYTGLQDFYMWHILVLYFLGVKII